MNHFIKVGDWIVNLANVTMVKRGERVLVWTTDSDEPQAFTGDDGVRLLAYFDGIAQVL